MQKKGKNEKKTRQKYTKGTKRSGALYEWPLTAQSICVPNFYDTLSVILPLFFSFKMAKKLKKTAENNFQKHVKKDAKKQGDCC